MTFMKLQFEEKDYLNQISTYQNDDASLTTLYNQLVEKGLMNPKFFEALLDIFENTQKSNFEFVETLLDKHIYTS